MNRRLNATRSDRTHARLAANPEEWAQYHSLYRAARASWPVVPYEEIIRFYEQRQGLVIADFGCGEAKLAAALEGRHRVHSFDHVAINQTVTTCDMRSTPLPDGCLDGAVFCLSLMGSNFTDYLREAYRTLKTDATLWIVEATSRFSDLPRFLAGLTHLGFEVVNHEERDRFTFIRALRAPTRLDANRELAF
jgi:hypothetical protein